MARWEKEIQDLQTRTETPDIEDVDIGDGVVIAIRTNITQAEAETLDEYNTKIQQANKEGNTELARKYSYKLYALVTANPLITEEWCEQNKSKYNILDMTLLISRFSEIAAERQRKVLRAQSFRSK